MATRIDIELTSRREDDDTFTWRAAGAKQPKGVAATSLFPDGASIGDVFKVDADVELDGITITFVHPPKGERKKPQLLELVSQDTGPLVTETRAPKGRGGRDGRRGGRRRDGDDRGRGRGRGDGERGRGGDGDRGRGRKPMGPKKPKLPPKPKPPRLNAGRAHRKAFLDGLPAEQRPIGDELVRGGLPGLRKAVAKQNEEHKAAGRPEVGDELIAIGERLMKQVLVAEWRDRADAALDQADTVDLRDLRSVVTAADSTAKDEESLAIRGKLQEALQTRLEADTAAWIAEVIEMLDDDRVVRALHLSSRPPKAGAPLPADVAQRLVEAANNALTDEITQDRWIYLLEALASSPIRKQVVPTSLPSNVGDDLRNTIARLGDRLPDIAHIFGIEPDPKAARPKRPDRQRKGRGRGDKKGDQPASKDRKKGGEKADRNTDKPKGGDKANRDTGKPKAADTADTPDAEGGEKADTPEPKAADTADTPDAEGGEKADTPEPKAADTADTPDAEGGEKADTPEPKAADTADTPDAEGGEKADTPEPKAADTADTPDAEGGEKADTPEPKAADTADTPDAEGGEKADTPEPKAADTADTPDAEGGEKADTPEPKAADTADTPDAEGSVDAADGAEPKAGSDATDDTTA